MNEKHNKMEIAIVGTGISGLSAAWLLNQEHQVTVYEANSYIGGHSNTVDVIERDRSIAVDTGFIVYNEQAYPNLCKLFEHLDVATTPTEMSFAISKDNGSLEYASNGFDRLFAQRRNIASPRFWKMILDLKRFYDHAPKHIEKYKDYTLDEYLNNFNYSTAFRDDHLYPMAAAIWSTPAIKIGQYPFVSFIKFCMNHSLLQLTSRPKWRTVTRGSREYVRRITKEYSHKIILNDPVISIERFNNFVEVVSKRGRRRFDHVVLSCHADQSLRMIKNPSDIEINVLGSFKYERNQTFLHSDPILMPKNKKVWSSWNYISNSSKSDSELTVTYWMNNLQGLITNSPLLVSLNPKVQPRDDLTHMQISYEHPVFSQNAVEAQKSAWQMQGVNRTWFCGSYFGYGFHEDGLQSGLAVAEQLSGRQRPWNIPTPSSRIFIPTSPIGGQA